jgi:hypothetical protein
MQMLTVVTMMMVVVTMVMMCSTVGLSGGGVAGIEVVFISGNS